MELITAAIIWLGICRSDGAIYWLVSPFHSSPVGTTDFAAMDFNPWLELQPLFSTKTFLCRSYGANYRSNNLAGYMSLLWSWNFVLPSMNSPVGTTDLAAMDFNPWLQKLTIVLLRNVFYAAPMELNFCAA